MPPAANDDTLAGESCLPAVIVCAIGYFMRLVLSEPSLNLFGLPYGDSDASTLEKIHPGNYFIILSFLILLCRRADPINQLVRIADNTPLISLSSLFMCSSSFIGFYVGLKV